MDKSNKSRDEGAELTNQNTEFEKTQFDKVLSLKEHACMHLKPWIFIATIKKYLEITNGEVNCRELRTFVLPDP